MRGIEYIKILLIINGFLLVGGILNSIAISQNGMKMPVFGEITKDFRLTHFSYDNFKDVNYPYLTDGFCIFDWGCFSAGDVFIWIGQGLGIFTIFMMVYFNLIKKKIENDKTTIRK